MPSIVSLARFAAVALALGAILPPVAPAAAQGLVDMPTIAYPVAGTRWGCRFDATCAVTGARSEPRWNRGVERNARTPPGAASAMPVPATVWNRRATRVGDPTAEPRPNGGTLARAGVSRSADSR